MTQDRGTRGFEPETRSGVEELSGALPRILGVVEGARPGPTLLCVGGVHGNEPAGVAALQRVLPVLRERRDRMEGRFVGLVGNRRALAEGRRFVDVDLNRAWGEGRPRVGEGSVSVEGAEAAERNELLAAIEEATAGATGPFFLVDLHTTSGMGGIFTTVSDTLRNRAFALELPVPLVLGLEELVDGTLVADMVHRGFVAMVFESGQHEEADAVDRAEAGIWLSVVTAGLLSDAEVPEAAEGRKRLARDTEGLPRVLEMRYRHPVDAGDDFEMRSGFENFQPVLSGEALATDDGRAIAAPEAGRILMPLYQEQGNDGFFIVREFNAFWLSISQLLRRLRFGRVVHLLPGVRVAADVEGGLEVDRRIARWYALHLFHLLGYRKLDDQGHRLLVIRRPEDN